MIHLKRIRFDQVGNWLDVIPVSISISSRIQYSYTRNCNNCWSTYIPNLVIYIYFKLFDIML
jgi:hypothetical protein